MKDRLTSNNSTRRDFIKQLGLLGFMAGLPPALWSCSTEGTGYKGTGIAPYSVWEEMLLAMQTSPDHLEGRMNMLIQEGNPEAMLRFVRDEIYLMPTTSSSLWGLGKAMRYGISGVLRYGFATPREKAELLHAMFIRANIQSSMVYERTNFEPDDVTAFFYRPIERKFAPSVDKKTLARWSKEMYGENSKSEVVNPDPELKESKMLADRLWDLIPEKEKIRAHTFDFRWDNVRTPVVEFEWEGETKYAHLFDATVPFGSLKNPVGRGAPAEEAVYIDEKISVSVTYRTGVHPQIEKELISAAWNAHELVGNQIVCSFLHGLDLEKQFTTSVGSLRIFTPTLSFQSFDADRPFMEARSFLGNPVTLEGKIIDVSGEKATIGSSTLLAKPNANLQKDIRQIEVKAIPGSYPLVKLHVSPLDVNGDIIEGLSAADFSVSDNSAPAQAILESNQRTPSVLILYDTSLSMPQTYSGENMDAFVASLESAILEKYPNTQITTWKTNSDLYTWLSKASHTSSDLIIFATDGDNGDTYIATKMEKLKFGPPAIVLNVTNTTGRSHNEAFENMAKATNGLVLNAKDQEKTIANVTRYLDDLEISPYVFTYYATDDKISHRVVITADNQRLTASDEYTFDLIANENAEAGEHIVGLYLHVQVGKLNVRRVLAGWDNSIDINRKPSFKDSADVRNMFLGNILIAVEGEGPTLSNALCDVLKYRLSTRKWGEAIIQNYVEKAVEAFAEGVYVYDETLASLMAPLQNAVTSNSFTFAAGPRIAIIKTIPGINREFSSLNFDYLPTSNYVTLSSDPIEGFKTTLEKTAQMAILENNFFGESTFSLLASKNITSSLEARKADWFTQLYREGPDARYWYENIFRGGNSIKFFDRSGSEKAFWRIDERTGELYGMLPDMTGGGTNHIQAQLDELSRVMNMYSLIFSAAGVGSLPIGIVQAYGMMLVKLYAIASEAIIIMDTTGMDEKIIAAMQQFACNVKKEIILATMGPVGTAISGLDNLIGLMGGGGIPGMQC
jgi:hypothetical protein